MLGDRIKKERIKKEITQNELAKIIGVSASTIGMYEQNRREPDSSSLTKIADYFKVTTDYLLGRDEINTIAAHIDSEEFTEDELKDIEDFKEYVRSRKKKK